MQIYLRFPEAQPNFKLRSRLILVQAELLDKKGKVLETISTIVGREKSKYLHFSEAQQKSRIG